MHLRPAEPEDLDRLFADLREVDKETLNRFGGLEQARDVVDQLILQFPHQLFVADDGRIAALWIGLRKWDGVMEIVGYTGNATEENVVGFFRACRRGINYLKEHLGIHKLECIVWGDYDRSVGWLERLGFQEEGLLRQHGPDKSDATMMGRIL